MWFHFMFSSVAQTKLASGAGPGLVLREAAGQWAPGKAARARRWRWRRDAAARSPGGQQPRCCPVFLFLRRRHIDFYVKPYCSLTSTFFFPKTWSKCYLYQTPLVGTSCVRGPQWVPSGLQTSNSVARRTCRIWLEIASLTTVTAFSPCIYGFGCFVLNFDMGSLITSFLRALNSAVPHSDWTSCSSALSTSAGRAGQCHLSRKGGLPRFSCLPSPPSRGHSPLLFVPAFLILHLHWESWLYSIVWTRLTFPAILQTLGGRIFVSVTVLDFSVSPQTWFWLMDKNHVNILWDKIFQCLLVCLSNLLSQGQIECSLFAK